MPENGIKFPCRDIKPFYDEMVMTALCLEIYYNGMACLKLANDMVYNTDALKNNEDQNKSRNNEFYRQICDPDR